MPARNPRCELPPTAGLPIRAADWLRSPRRPFAEAVGKLLGIPLVPHTACSGTAALMVILAVLRTGSPNRQEVILPAYTCPLVPLAVIRSGLIPVLCDVAGEHFDFHFGRLEALCSSRTLAVISTHLGGQVADVPTALAIASSHGAAVIEDAAQALGARNNGQSLGLVGDAAFFSLAAGKGLTTFEGGLFFSRHPALHAELANTGRRLLPPRFAWSLRRNAELLALALAYKPRLLPFVYGRPLRAALARGEEERAVGDLFSLNDIPLHSLDRLRLRVAGNALSRLPDFLEQGRTRAAQRTARLATGGRLKVLHGVAGSSPVWPMLMTLMPDKASRDKALRALWTAGLGVTRLFIHALPDSASLAGLLPAAAPCPNARELAGRMLTVTNSHWLCDESFENIATVLEDACS